MPTVFYGAGNFVLQSKVENEVKFAEEVLKRTNEFNRLISFYFKKELANTLEVKRMNTGLKVIIAGSRDINDFDLVLETVKKSGIKISEISEIVSGGAKGVDSVGESIAKAFGIPVKKFPADWDKHGKVAGFIRNKEMADYSDALIAVWDCRSKGTKHMIETMKKVKKFNYTGNGRKEIV